MSIPTFSGASQSIAPNSSTRISGGIPVAPVTPVKTKAKVVSQKQAGTASPTQNNQTPTPVQTSVVTLAGVGLKDYEVPASVSMSGNQDMAVHQFPGGARRIDVMGPNPEPITWSGIMLGSDTNERVRLFAALRDAGQSVPLFVGDFFFTVVIKSFKADISFYEAKYSIALEIVPTVTSSSTSSPIQQAQQTVAQAMTNVTTGIQNMTGNTLSTSTQSIGSSQGVTSSLDSDTSEQLPQMSAANDTLSDSGDSLNDVPDNGLFYNQSNTPGLAIPGDSGYTSPTGNDPGFTQSINPNDPGFSTSNNAAGVQLDQSAQTLSEGNATNDQQLSDIADSSSNGMTSDNLNAAVTANGQQAQLMPVQGQVVNASNSANMNSLSGFGGPVDINNDSFTTSSQVNISSQKGLFP